MKIIRDSRRSAYRLTRKAIFQSYAGRGGHGKAVNLADLRGIKVRGRVLAWCPDCEPDGIDYSDASNFSYSVTILAQSVRIGCTRFTGKDAKAILKAIGR